MTACVGPGSVQVPDTAAGNRPSLVKYSVSLSTGHGVPAAVFLSWNLVGLPPSPQQIFTVFQLPAEQISAPLLGHRSSVRFDRYLVLYHPGLIL